MDSPQYRSNKDIKNRNIKDVLNLIINGQSSIPDII